ncbi:MAG: winged helix-turn-helix transcriptional regulator [Candidatus Lokiarchaeota archaeon]|nr:winged helix-turn-helix transcriptional regulator [Candidatus Lokiarchaeota archaeon]
MLDTIDFDILKTLQKNCRTPLTKIAARHGLSSNAIKFRISELEKSGVIRGYHVFPSLGIINSTRIFCTSSVQHPIAEKKLLSVLREIEQVSSVGFLLDGSMYLFGLVTSNAEIPPLRRKIKALEELSNIQFNIVKHEPRECMELQYHHFQILEELVRDVRSPISTIAKNCGMTRKHVSENINEMITNNAIFCTIDIDFLKGEHTLIILRIKWDPKNYSFTEILRRIESLFSELYWFNFISTSKSEFYIALYIPHIRDSFAIVQIVLDISGVTKVSVRVPIREYLFRHIEKEKLIELIEQNL